MQYDTMQGAEQTVCWALLPRIISFGGGCFWRKHSFYAAHFILLITPLVYSLFSGGLEINKGVSQSTGNKLTTKELEISRFPLWHICTFLISSLRVLEKTHFTLSIAACLCAVVILFMVVLTFAVFKASENYQEFWQSVRFIPRLLAWYALPPPTMGFGFNNHCLSWPVGSI